jgi:filamentous hemagglutinin
VDGVLGYAGHATATAVVQAGVGTAINGGSFGDNLSGALSSQLQSVLQAVAFNAVGDYSQGQWDDGSPQKIALHAMVGGLLSEAAGGDFATGALAAGANEALIEQLSALAHGDDNLLLMASQLVGVAVAGLTDGDAQLGADIAKNATSYNFLNHQDVEQLAEELVDCRTAADPATCRSDVEQRYRALSDEMRGGVLYECQKQGAVACGQQLDAAIAGSEALDRLLAQAGFTDDELNILDAFEDSNWGDSFTARHADLQAVLMESGAVGGILLGGAAGLGSTGRVVVGGAKGNATVPEIKWSAQEKHFPGHNSYTSGRSTLTSDPRTLAEKAGTGQQVGNLPIGTPGSKERVNFGGAIGNYIDPVTGKATPTSSGIIHYSKDGIHIVPARP